MGWLNPWVDAGLVGGPVLIAVFVVYEQRVKDPMLDMSLFRIRAFAGRQRRHPVRRPSPEAGSNSC